MSLLLRADGISKVYDTGVGARPAVDRVSFDVAPGETLALVGESGSGKSTVGRMVLKLEPLSDGEVYFEGRPLSRVEGAALKALRPRMQMIFQDPYSALNPRMRVGDFVGEPLLVHRREPNRSARQDRVAELFRMVGLDPSLMRRLPHEFSGGQRQRINIARALALSPPLIVADEPITALDVSIQAQIVNLLRDIQDQTGVAYLFISHDLGMVRYLSHRVAVMRAGRIVEVAPAPVLFDDARHPYTRALLSAAPVADPRIECRRQRLHFDPQRHPTPLDATLRFVAPHHQVLE